MDQMCASPLLGWVPTQAVTVGASVGKGKLNALKIWKRSEEVMQVFLELDESWESSELF